MTYKSLDAIADDLPDHSPRFVLLSYPLTMVRCNTACCLFAEYPRHSHESAVLGFVLCDRYSLESSTDGYLHVLFALPRVAVQQRDHAPRIRLACGCFAHEIDSSCMSESCGTAGSRRGLVQLCVGMLRDDRHQWNYRKNSTLLHTSANIRHRLMAECPSHMCYSTTCPSRRTTSSRCCTPEQKSSSGIRARQGE